MNSDITASSHVGYNEVFWPYIRQDVGSRKALSNCSSTKQWLLHYCKWVIYNCIIMHAGCLRQLDDFTPMVLRHNRLPTTKQICHDVMYKICTIAGLWNLIFLKSAQIRVLTRQAMYLRVNVIFGCVRLTVVSVGKAVNIKYCECVSLWPCHSYQACKLYLLGGRIVLPSLVRLAAPCFPHIISQTARFSGGGG